MLLFGVFLQSPRYIESLFAEGAIVRKDFGMYARDVVGETGRLSEPFHAMGTGIRPLSSVQPEVHLQMAGLNEIFPTIRAPVRPFTGMHALVLDQATLERESSPAGITTVVLPTRVLQQVPSEMVFQGESPRALWAGMDFLPGMGEQVSAEVSSNVRRVGTMWAPMLPVRLWLHANVCLLMALQAFGRGEEAVALVTREACNFL